MKIEDGALVRDQNSDFDGARGDSCFETSALALSHFWLTGEYHPQLNLDQFITPTGTVRHPLIKWRQDDQSEDNEKPLFIFMRETCNTKNREFIYEQCFDDFKTGNHRYITWGYFAELQNIQYIRCFVLVVQVIFFWFPWYWDDGRMKNLVENVGKQAGLRGITLSIWFKLLWQYWPIGNAWKKTDGFLMWALIAKQAPWIFRKLICKSTLKKKIIAYYEPEGASGLWVVETHLRLLDKFF